MSDFKTFKTVNNLSNKEIAELLGTSDSFISQMVTGIAKLPADKLTKIKELALVNNWDTSMLGTTESSTAIVPAPENLPVYTEAEVEDAEVIEVPYVTQSVAQDPHLDIKELIENREIETRNLMTLLGNFDGVQSVFRNAMEPLYHRGDLLLFRYVSTTGRLLQGTYILDIDNMGAMLCMLIDNGQTVDLSFLNPNFKSITIPRKDIRSAATIVRHIRDERTMSLPMKNHLSIENMNKMLAQHDSFLKQTNALIAQHDSFLAQQNKLIDLLINKQ